MMKYIRYTLLLTTILVVVAFGYMNITGQNTNEIGLKVLTMVKKIKGDAVAVEKVMVDTSPQVRHQSWTILLDELVTPEGVVNYRGFINKKEQLQSYLDRLSSTPPGRNWSREEQLAYWINAYNAFTVKLIIDHYPIKSIKDIASGLPMIDSPWDIKFFKIGEVDMDLNTIEHQILRKQFDDYRIHFAINCASESCPVLRNEAYETSTLEAQLQDQEAGFILDKSKNRVGVGDVKLSPIFSWFNSDFTKKTSVIDLVKKYHTNLSTDAEVAYLDYDWNLNE